MENLPIPLNILAEGKINHVITEKFSLLEARKANELLEGGQVTRIVVLIAPELL
jgi:NADPH:quinone reductase-like Zn-dependent oxidoreductase